MSVNMIYVLREKREDVVALPSELGLEVSSEMTRLVILELILKDIDDKKYGEERVKHLMEGIVQEGMQRRKKEREEYRRSLEKADSLMKFYELQAEFKARLQRYPQAQNTSKLKLCRLEILKDGSLDKKSEEVVEKIEEKLIGTKIDSGAKSTVEIEDDFGIKKLFDDEMEISKSFVIGDYCLKKLFSDASEIDDNQLKHINRKIHEIDVVAEEEVLKKDVEEGTAINMNQLKRQRAEIKDDGRKKVAIANCKVKEAKPKLKPKRRAMLLKCRIGRDLGYATSKALLPKCKKKRSAAKRPISEKQNKCERFDAKSKRLSKSAGLLRTKKISGEITKMKSFKNSDKGWKIIRFKIWSTLSQTRCQHDKGYYKFNKEPKKMMSFRESYHRSYSAQKKNGSP